MNLDDIDFSGEDASRNRLFDDWNPNPSPESGSLVSANDSLNGFAISDRASSPADATVVRSSAAVQEFEADFLLGNSGPRELSGNRTDAARDGETAATQPISRPIVFPKLGDGVGGFRLISELGRGAFARVYLAHEVALGNRPVALKVSKAEGDEPRILARLQHTHIVPIHSVYDERSTGLRLICMPYFGGANLAQVLDAAGPRVANQTQGQSLVDALDLIGQPIIASRPIRLARETRRPSVELPNSERSIRSEHEANLTTAPTLHRSLRERISWWPRDRSEVVQEESVASEADPSQPARQFLLGSSYVRGSVWIMTRLAEGLEHAHSRGLLHRDLKPSNILIAADGTPMLLDFNLATDTYATEAEDGSKAMMGGTLPYMSPEHLDAFNPKGAGTADSIDERSDLYALGLILFEMIAGHSAFPAPPAGMKLIEMLGCMTLERRQGAPSLREVNAEVPWSLDAIIAKCLDPNPDRRFRSAGELAEDLRRFLDDQPLKFTSEPSLRESVIKWARRHPRASSAWTIVPVAMSFLLLVGGIAFSQAGHLRQMAARLGLRRFHENFNDCQFLLNTSSGSDLAGHLHRGVAKAQILLDRYGITRRGDWDQSYWVSSLAPDERAGLRRDLTELILLESRARLMIAKTEGNEDDRRRALDTAVARLNRAEKFDPSPSPALFADRARYYRALGQPELGRLDDERSRSTPASSSRDEYLLGTSELALGHYDLAEQRLNHAIALEPDRFWAWFTLGLCHFDQGRYADAVGDFNVCTVLKPEFAWSHANRGRALARGGRLSEACASYDQALNLSPSFTEALSGRGLAYLEMGNAQLADRDLSRAIEMGTRDPLVRVGRAEAIAKLGRQEEALTIYAELIVERPGDARLLSARGIVRLQTDPRAAEGDFTAALGLDPEHLVAHYGLARLHYRTDQMLALKHVDRALAIDPRYSDALQLRALTRARLGHANASDDVNSLILSPTPNRLFNASCVMAILAKNQPNLGYESRAIDLLRRALETGFPVETVRGDSDLISLHSRPEFRLLVGLEPQSH